MNRWFTIIIRCVLALPFITLLSSPLSQTPSSVPKELHAMPPHPALLEKLQQEGKSLPTLAARYSRGIDLPQHMTAPPTGNFKLLVVAVQFTDNLGTVAPTFFDNLVFATPGPSVNSVADYYDEISRSTLTLVTVNLPGATGWVTATLPYNGSGGYINADGVPSNDDYGWGSFPQNLQGIVWHVIPLIDSLVDFRNYDNDGDGFVDSVTFVHAGQGAEVTGNANHIWSSAWNLSDYQGPGPLTTQDGLKKVDNFSFEAEYMVNVSPSTSDQTIGMFSHELSHSLFGLPDLYDPDDSSRGVGSWSLMANGAWNGQPIFIPGLGWVSDGSSPAWPDAWSRTVMGFEQPMEVTVNLYSYPVNAVELSSGIVFKLWSPQLGPREYYLVENRQTVGYDALLPGRGLLIWHVDEDKWNAWEANQYECTTFPSPGCLCPTYHYLVSLEQADGLFDLEKKANYGDANDPYPYPYGSSPTKQHFMFGTNPESGSWYASPCASDSCLAVNNITVNFPGPPDVLMADFQVVCNAANSCVNILQPPVKWIEGGGTASQLVSLQNCGPSGFFDFSASSVWPASFYNPITGQTITNMFISNGGTTQLGVRVEVPESIGPGDGSTATMLVDPQGTTTTTFTTTLTTQMPTCVLLVDDDRSLPDVEASYITSLLQNRYNLDYWDLETQGNPEANDLSAHQSVIWFTGAYAYDTLHIRDEMNLADYLNGGGKFLLSSQDYLNDAFRTFFNRTYLGMGMYFNDLGATSVKGVYGSLPWQNLGPFTLTPPASGSDRFNPLPGAMAAFENENGYYNALAYDSGTWRSLFLAWPFESLALPDASAVMTTTMDWLDIAPRPTVSFTVGAPLVCTGEVVTFTNTTVGGTRWWWDFGDGSTSTMTDTVHTYYFPFTATVTLKGKNDCGFEFATRSIEVLQAPWVTFTVSSESVNIGDTVTFTSTVYDVDHLLWDFGDGVTSTLSNPTHIYTAPLTATVVLTGFSECGFATAQEVVGVDYGQTFVYLPLALKETGGFHAFRGEDWMLVALPITAGIMLLGKRRRQ